MLVQKIVEALLKNVPEIESDRKIYRMFWPSERYVVDFADDFTENGWEQFDTSQDAPYFGAWGNYDKRCTLTYAEGDWSLVVCDSIASYIAVINGMIDFYGEGFIAKAIDLNGDVTVVKQDRAQFLTA